MIHFRKYNTEYPTRIFQYIILSKRLPVVYAELSKFFLTACPVNKNVVGVVYLEFPSHLQMVEGSTQIYSNFFT